MRMATVVYDRDHIRRQRKVRTAFKKRAYMQQMSIRAGVESIAANGSARASMLKNLWATSDIFIFFFLVYMDAEFADDFWFEKEFRQTAWTLAIKEFPYGDAIIF